jgi:hypothetical protein
MAGITGMPVSRFLLFDGLGALAYIAVFVVIGFVWSDQIEAIGAAVVRLGGRLPVLAGAALAAYVAVKFVQRQLFLRRLRMARITPEELHRRIASGEDLIVVDLRHTVDFEAASLTIPGAIRVAIDDIERDHDRIPREREIVLFCT